MLNVIGMLACCYDNASIAVMTLLLASVGEANTGLTALPLSSSQNLCAKGARAAAPRLGRIKRRTQAALVAAHYVLPMAFS